MNWLKTHLSDYYEVSSTGLVRSIDRYINGKCGSKRLIKGRILKFTEDEDGYYRVGIHYDGESHTISIHRLVAEAFIPNPDKKPCIDHINGNRKDNRVENLRWCTVEENNSFEIARKRKSKSAFRRTDNKKIIYQYTLDGELIAEFNSTREAERMTGYKSSTIGNCASGKQNTSYGYIWSYKKV